MLAGSGLESEDAGLGEAGRRYVEAGTSARSGLAYELADRIKSLLYPFHGLRPDGDPDEIVTAEAVSDAGHGAHMALLQQTVAELHGAQRRPAE